MKLQNKKYFARAISRAAQSYRLLFFAIIFIGANFSSAAAQGAGSLDTTFGTGGRVTTAFSTDFSYGFASQIQTDGKIVVVGSTFNDFSGDRDFFVARYLPGGSLDNSFGKLGTVTINLSNSPNERASDVVIQPNGKIVVVGVAEIAGRGRDFAVVRLNANGTFDISFGTEGVVFTDFGSLDDYAQAVSIDSSNRIVVAGGLATRIARYATNGALDTTFGTGGKVTLVTATNSSPNDLLIQPDDGKIVVVGKAANNHYIARFLPNGSPDTAFGTNGQTVAGYAGANGAAFAVARDSAGGFISVGDLTFTATGQAVFGFFSYTANGSLNTSFGPEGDGAAIAAFGTSEDFPTDIAIQADGKIVAAGRTNAGSPGNPRFALVRLNSSGLIDNSFGTSGKVISSRGSFAYALNLQPDDKIIAVGGGSVTMPRIGIAIARYNANGVLDNSFNGDGFAETVVGSYDFAGKTVVQPDGKIIVAGSTDQSRTSLYSDFVLTRYNPNGSLDTSFGTGGKVQTAFLDSSSGIRSIALQPDGKIVAAGNASLGRAKSDYALARYNSDGSLDTSFGTNGKTTIDFLSDYEFLYDVALQSDGKIVAVGYDQLVVPSSGADFLTLRFKSDGSIDSTFGTNGIVRTDFGISRADQSNALVVQANGKIVVAGTTTRSDGFVNIAAVRYELNGALDTTFDVDGKVSVSFGAFSALANDAVIGTDGNIVIAGAAGSGTIVDFALVRIKNDGSLDAGFDADGRATVNFDTSFSGLEENAAPSAVSNDQAFAVAIQTDGKIVVGGDASIGETSDFALARLNYDGSLDTSFNTDGKTTTNFGKTDFVSTIAIQSNQGIVVAGITESFSDPDITIARYTGIAATAANSSIGGRVTTADGRGIANARLTLTSGSGAVRYASTGSFGNYRFDDLPTGENYVLTVSAKRSVFAQPTLFINLNEELTNVIFTSEP